MGLLQCSLRAAQFVVWVWKLHHNITTSKLGCPHFKRIMFGSSIIYGLLSNRKLWHYIISLGINPLTSGATGRTTIIPNLWFLFFSSVFLQVLWIIGDRGLVLKSVKREWQRKEGLGLRKLFPVNLGFLFLKNNFLSQLWKCSPRVLRL